ncbi:MAG: VacB/RNase II family 3'-5' exoribonuclease [Planctomycetaceae bacterium]|jgi:ribonuclease R|nr:VacB/RNase II family 3'-5' exoribonuclease [Planctomycetaceae bacterium]
MSFNSNRIRSSILKIITHPNYIPAKTKDFIDVLNLSYKDLPALRSLVARMISDGELEYDKKHYILPSRETLKSKQNKKSTSPKYQNNNNDNYIDNDDDYFDNDNDDGNDSYLARPILTGRFQRRPSGIGFVRLRAAAAGEDAPVDDIFVPAHWTKDAASGDTVAVEIMTKRKHNQNRSTHKKRRNKHRTEQNNDFPDDDRKLRGRIVKIIERASNRFVGTYIISDGWAFVQIDGSIFKRRIPIGDALTSQAQNGDKVVVEMVKFPTPHNDGEAVIVEVLGAHGVPGLDTLLIMRQFELPEYFSEAALVAARNEVEKFFKLFPDDSLQKESDWKLASDKLASMNRLDLTKELIITIDPADARDFDDAVSLERLSNGNFRLGVHIADVNYFVKATSPIDKEARDRATSVYLPDRVIPMLPEVLSNALASLQPGKVRFTKSVFIEFTPSGMRANVEVYRSAICSVRRFNYDEVQDFFDTPEKFTKTWGESVCNLLSELREFMLLLRRRRFERGSLELDVPEIKIELDENGLVSGARVYPYYDSNRVIEECMLAANEAVAEFIDSKHILFLRRVHSGPSMRKLRSFTNFVRMLEIANLREDDIYRDRFIIQRLLEAVKGTAQEYAVNISLLRSMQKAVYSPETEGHYALASKCYCHFTSPIRRYPDVLVHRLLDEILDGANPKPDTRELVLLGEHCSDREQRAEEAERELKKLKLIDYMSERIGEKLEALVTNVELYGAFVMGTKIPAEGLVRIEGLTDDFYRFQRDAKILIGLKNNNVLRIGDRLIVEVVRADLDARQIDFRMVKRIKSKLPNTKFKE